MEEKTIPQSRAARQLPMHKGAAPCKKPSANGFPQTILHFAVCIYAVPFSPALSPGGWRKRVQNVQTEKEQGVSLLFVTRSRTSSKQSPHAPFYLFGKIYARSLAFPLPKKSGWTFRGPRKSQDFKGKRSNEVKKMCLRIANHPKRPLRHRREAKFVQSTKRLFEEIRKMRISTQFFLKKRTFKITLLFLLCTVCAFFGIPT